MVCDTCSHVGFSFFVLVAVTVVVVKYYSNIYIGCLLSLPFFETNGVVRMATLWSPQR